MQTGYILHPKSDDSILPFTCTIIRACDARNKVYLINSEEKPRKPFSLQLDDINNEIREGKIIYTKISYSYYELLPDKEIKPSWLKKRDQRFKVIEPILYGFDIEGKKDEEAIFDFLDHPKTNNSIQKASNKSSYSRVSVYKYLYMFFQGGCRKNSLLPEFHKIGKSCPEGVKVGRPNEEKYDEDEHGNKEKIIGLILSEKDKENIKNSITEHYYKQEKPDLKDSYNNMCDKHYSYKYKDKDGIEISCHFNDNNKPSLVQYRYWAYKYIDPSESIKNREGSSKYEKDFRALTSTSDYGLRGPGELYEIDATVGDIFLVSEFDRTKSIGRPVVYLVTDVFSRCIVGIYVGLEGPSWDGARAVLFNTCRDKVEFCAEYGLTIKPEDWPCHHMCYGLFADRGELISKKAEVALDNLGLQTMGFASPYRGDLKGLVEKHFDVINNLVLKDIPGNSVKMKRERGQKKPELDACLTLKELTRLLIEEIIDNNLYQVKKVVGDIEMMKDDVIPTPVNLWNWGMEFGIGTANSIAPHDLYLGLLPSEKATVREDGIYFNGLRYSSETAIKKGWQAKVRIKKRRFKVNIRYTTSTTNFIWLINPDTQKLEICYLNDTMEKFKNLELNEYLGYQKKINIETDAANRRRNNSKTKNRARRKKFIAEAKQKTEAARKSASFNSNRASHKDVKEHRDFEKQSNRKDDAKKAEEMSHFEQLSDSYSSTENDHINSDNKVDSKKKSLSLVDDLI
ncbi:Mu transposase C-terminal domain-containing protein [Endozoicomonas euniceicola]|uniref:Mu transposase C-terminal domain-containing protein n=1 Tax=Endozoicomonas euniceicola TaxID=1234143 RepID=A0ABY6GSE4_9GAMM|nr:Mu transposase C-terminal domain-containing protein [Endozoicomonas euniceicola]UYM14929.1 Mu transposase C-terminal domain-containing protein [Endozoicomonas euniceicola]